MKGTLSVPETFSANDNTTDSRVKGFLSLLTFPQGLHLSVQLPTA